MNGPHEYVWVEYLLEMAPEKVHNVYGDARVKSVCLKTGCKLEVTKRVLNRLISPSTWARLPILRITGPDDQSIAQFNKLLETWIPDYANRKEYPRRAPVSFLSRSLGQPAFRDLRNIPVEKLRPIRSNENSEDGPLLNGYLTDKIRLCKETDLGHSGDAAASTKNEPDIRMRSRSPKRGVESKIPRPRPKPRPRGLSKPREDTSALFNTPPKDLNAMQTKASQIRNVRSNLRTHRRVDDGGEASHPRGTGKRSEPSSISKQSEPQAQPRRRFQIPKDSSASAGATGISQNDSRTETSIGGTNSIISILGKDRISTPGAVRQDPQISGARDYIETSRNDQTKPTPGMSSRDGSAHGRGSPTDYLVASKPAGRGHGVTNAAGFGGSSATRPANEGASGGSAMARDGALARLEAGSVKRGSATGTGGVSTRSREGTTRSIEGSTKNREATTEKRAGFISNSEEFSLKREGTAGSGAISTKHPEDSTAQREGAKAISGSTKHTSGLENTTPTAEVHEMARNAISVEVDNNDAPVEPKDAPSARIPGDKLKHSRSTPVRSHDASEADAVTASSFTATRNSQPAGVIASEAKPTSRGAKNPGGVAVDSATARQDSRSSDVGNPRHTIDGAMKAGFPSADAKSDHVPGGAVSHTTDGKEQLQHLNDSSGYLTQSFSSESGIGVAGRPNDGSNGASFVHEKHKSMEAIHTQPLRTPSPQKLIIAADSKDAQHSLEEIPVTQDVNAVGIANADIIKYEKASNLTDHTGAPVADLSEVKPVLEVGPNTKEENSDIRDRTRTISDPTTLPSPPPSIEIGGERDKLALPPPPPELPSSTRGKLEIMEVWGHSVNSAEHSANMQSPDLHQELDGHAPLSSLGSIKPAVISTAVENTADCVVEGAISPIPRLAMSTASMSVQLKSRKQAGSVLPCQLVVEASLRMKKHRVVSPKHSSLPASTTSSPQSAALSPSEPAKSNHIRSWEFKLSRNRSAGASPIRVDVAVDLSDRKTATNTSTTISPNVAENPQSCPKNENFNNDKLISGNVSTVVSVDLSDVVPQENLHNATDAATADNDATATPVSITLVTELLEEGCGTSTLESFYRAAAPPKQPRQKCPWDAREGTLPEFTASSSPSSACDSDTHPIPSLKSEAFY